MTYELSPDEKRIVEWLRYVATENAKGSPFAGRAAIEQNIIADCIERGEHRKEQATLPHTEGEG